MALIFYTGGPAAAVAYLNVAAGTPLVEQSALGPTLAMSYGPLMTFPLTRIPTQRYYPTMYAIRQSGAATANLPGTKASRGRAPAGTGKRGGNK